MGFDQGKRAFSLALKSWALLFAAGLFVFVMTPKSLQAEESETLIPLGEAVIEGVGPGYDVTLSSGETIRLMGLHWGMPMAEGDPLLSLLSRTMASWQGETVDVSVTGWTRDRYGRLTGQLRDKGGERLAGRLVSAGLAIPYNSPDLARHEYGARQARLGLWATEDAVQCAGDVWVFAEGLLTVQGHIRDVATVNGVTYLNFGSDWREDFTARLSKANRAAFAGVDLVSFKGKDVEVRGWVFPSGGPMIDLEYMTQIRVKDDIAERIPACFQE